MAMEEEGGLPSTRLGVRALASCPFPSSAFLFWFQLTLKAAVCMEITCSTLPVP